MSIVNMPPTFCFLETISWLVEVVIIDLQKSKFIYRIILHFSEGFKKDTIVYLTLYTQYSRVSFMNLNISSFPIVKKGFSNLPLDVLVWSTPQKCRVLSLEHMAMPLSLRWKVHEHLLGDIELAWYMIWPWVCSHWFGSLWRMLGQESGQKYKEYQVIKGEECHLE